MAWRLFYQPYFGYRSIGIVVGLTIILMSQRVTAAGELKHTATSFPKCGPVATYAFLAAVGIKPTIRDVEAMFLEVNPDIDLARVSLWEIREVLKRFGVSTVALRQSPSNFSKLRLPAILFVKGQHRLRVANDNVGHFVLLASVENGHAEVIDWSRITGPERRHVVIDELVAEWGGEGIVLDDSATSVAWGVKSTVSFVGLMCLAWWLWLAFREFKLKVSPRSSATCLILALFAACAGCEKVESPISLEAPLISVEKPSINLGKIASGQPVRVEFVFKVIAKQSVSITEIAPCCGTLLVNKNLIGQSLATGSEHKIVLEANGPSGDAQPRTSFARITTDPKSEIPLVVAFTYLPIGAPRPLVKEIVVTGRPHQLCEAEVTTVGWRLPTDSAVRLVLEKCVSSDFEIVAIKERSESIKTDENSTELTLQDFQTIRLRSRQMLELGEHRSVLRLSWSDGTTSDVFLIVKVAPPIHLAIDRLFVGVLSPSQEWKRSIPIIQEEQTPLSFAPVSCSVDYASATISPDGRTLEVRLTAPVIPGRIDGEIRLRLQPGDWPVIRIPITGIVK